MRTYKKKSIKIDILDKVFCDKCKKEIVDECIYEMYSISFVGGYLSVFGDGTEVNCDLCQECLHELIGNFCERS